jgi:hypothetical protein
MQALSWRGIAEEVLHVEKTYRIELQVSTFCIFIYKYLYQQMHDSEQPISGLQLSLVSVGVKKAAMYTCISSGLRFLFPEKMGTS